VLQNTIEPFCLSVHGFCHPYVACSSLDPISVDLRFGEALWVQGANGAGKTTFLSCIVGIEKYFQGNINAASAFYCGHLNALKDEQTVFQNLKFRSLLMNGSFSMDKITNALAVFSMENLLHVSIGHLSQGQKRKVALCSATLSSHKFWVFDEPLIHLDTPSVEQFQCMAHSHLIQGGSVLATSHVNPFLSCGNHPPQYKEIFI
jgi:heme exporter protein A